MMISVALLGYGAAGTFVALAQRALLPRFDAVFAGGAVLFGITAVARLRARPAGRLQSAGDPVGPAAAAAPARHLRAALRALLLRRDLRLPHVHAVRRAAAPDLQLRHPRRGRGKPRDAGRALPARADRRAEARRRARDRRGGAGARSAAAPRQRSARRRRCSPPRSPSPLVIPADWIRLRPSEYKELSQTLRIDGTRIVAEAVESRWVLVTVVESARVPFRHAPGMSLNATMEPPPQLAVFTDGDGLERADPLRRPARAARLSRPAHVRAAVPPARAAAGAGARRGRRRRRAAGDLPRRAQRSTPSSSIRRSSISCERRFADFSGRAVQRARRAHPHRRSARLRRRARAIAST